MAGTSGSILYADNIDFSGGYPVQGEINLNGELFVGSTVAPNIRPYVPTGSNGLVVNKGPGTLDFTLANIPNTALANSTVSIVAGSGLSGGGLVSLGGSITLNATGSGTVTSVSGTANQVAVATGTTTPVISLVGPYTPATYTAHGVLVGEGTSSIVALGAGTAGQVLQSGGASADPAYSTATYPAASVGSGKILYDNGTNFVTSTPTFPANASATTRKIIVSDGTNWTASTETWAVPGASGNVLTSDGTNWTSAAAPGAGITLLSGTLTNSQIKALHGTPVELVAAPGSGKVILLLSATAKFIYGGSNAFTAGAAQTIDFYYANNTTSITTGAFITNNMITSTANKFSAFSTFTLDTKGNQVAGVLDNVNLAFWNSVATEITGNAANDNTFHWNIVYQVITF